MVCIMRLEEIDRQECSVAKAMAEIGDAWSLLILREAFYGRRRFSDFVANTGAQKTVVSARLKQLVAAGILERVEYSQYPTRHNYLLTGKGRELAPVMFALAKWGDRWHGHPRGLRVQLTHACGHHVDATMVCGACGEPLHPADVTASAGPGFPPDVPDPFAPATR